MFPVLFINKCLCCFLIFGIRCRSLFCCRLFLTALCVGRSIGIVIGTKNLYTVCVSILDDTYPGLTGIHGDLVSIGIIVESSTPWGMFFPGDINGFSVYDVFSYVRFVNIDVQITVFIVFSPGRILQNNVFISNLLTGQLIDLFVAILETIIQFVLRIVFKPWLVQEISRFYNVCFGLSREVPLHRPRRRMHIPAGSLHRIPGCSR